MPDAPRVRLVASVTAAGLRGTEEPELLRGFCEEALAVGVPIRRAMALIDTLHPIYEGRAFRWSERKAWHRSPNMAAPPKAPRPPPNGGEHVPSLCETGATEPAAPAAAARPARVPDPGGAAPRRLHGISCPRHRFATDRVIGEMDCVYSYLVDRSPGGFPDARGRRRSTARCRLWPWRSRRPPCGASPTRWSRPISAATPAGSCCPAASPAGSPRRSPPPYGSPICAASRPSPTPARPRP